MFATTACLLTFIHWQKSISEIISFPYQHVRHAPIQLPVRAHFLIGLIICAIHRLRLFITVAIEQGR